MKIACFRVETALSIQTLTIGEKLMTKKPEIIEALGAFCIFFVELRSSIYVMVQKHPDRVFWELPGGALRYGEVFADALYREIKEELASPTLLSYLGSNKRLEAMCQQRVRVGDGIFSIGLVQLFSCQCHENAMDAGTRDFVFQKDEVESARWMSIEDAITHTETDNPDWYLGLAFRRMLMIFYKRWLLRKQGREMSEYSEHALGKVFTPHLLLFPGAPTRL